MKRQATISDVIPIAPTDLGKKSPDAIHDGIHSKYSNRVLHKVGLCLCLWDLLSASEGLINAGDSRVHVDGERGQGGKHRARLLMMVAVTFRMVVFRPFKGEIVQAIITKIDKDGILRTFLSSVVDELSACSSRRLCLATRLTQCSER
jgi:DNA-directed RNA polymerase III subunit RPC8